MRVKHTFGTLRIAAPVIQKIPIQSVRSGVRVTGRAALPLFEANLSIIEKHSKKRSQMVPSTTYGTSSYSSFPMEVTVGGATVFVLNVERYEKL